MHRLWPAQSWPILSQVALRWLSPCPGGDYWLLHQCALMMFPQLLIWLPPQFFMHSLSKRPGSKYAIFLDSNTFPSFTELVWFIGTYEIFSRTANPAFWSFRLIASGKINWTKKNIWIQNNNLFAPGQLSNNWLDNISKIKLNHLVLCFNKHNCCSTWLCQECPYNDT